MLKIERKKKNVKWNISPEWKFFQLIAYNFKEFPNPVAPNHSNKPLSKDLNGIIYEIAKVW